jgi:hypothetical protein
LNTGIKLGNLFLFLDCNVPLCFYIVNKKSGFKSKNKQNIVFMGRYCNQPTGIQLITDFKYLKLRPFWLHDYYTYTLVCLLEISSFFNPSLMYWNKLFFLPSLKCRNFVFTVKILRVNYHVMVTNYFFFFIDF